MANAAAPETAWPLTRSTANAALLEGCPPALNGLPPPKTHRLLSATPLPGTLVFPAGMFAFGVQVLAAMS